MTRTEFLNKLKRESKVSETSFYYVTAMEMLEEGATPDELNEAYEKYGCMFFMEWGK